MTHTIIRLDETTSTNSFLMESEDCDGADIVVAAADYQTAGRGQGHNSWESERGKNLLFSIAVRPRGIAAARQFCLSMAGGLAVKDVLERYADGVRLKWPNDVYAGDRKISGTLIETLLCWQEIRKCVFGVGINVNQRDFLSDAPNPVSLYQLLGKETDRERLLNEVIEAFKVRYGQLSAGLYGRIASDYRASLYRSSGFFEYEDSGGRFMAELVGVGGDGTLTLQDKDGKRRRYAFKEVKYII